MSRPKGLTDHLRAQIVIRFAERYTPAEIREWLTDAHGVAIQPSALSYYNLNNPGAREGPAWEKWGELFERAKTAWEDAEIDEPILWKKYRARVATQRLQKLLEKDRVKEDVILRYLEYGAKEEGGAFTNRRELMGQGGGAIQLTTGLSDVSDADLLRGRDAAAAAVLGAG
jgi:hypothetical protein